MSPVSLGPRRAVAAVMLCTAIGTTTCDSKDPPARTTPTATPQAPELAPSPAREVIFPAAEGAQLSATLYMAEDRSAPVALLVHRFRGSRRELAGLAERLARAPRRYTILNIDLLGHGQSVGGDGGIRHFNDFKKEELSRLQGDVLAALDFAQQQTAGKARSAVIVGDGLGGTLAALAASQRSHVAALALISPGRRLEGVDLYQAYLLTRRLPLFLAGSTADNVSRTPIDDLSRLAQAPVTTRAYTEQGRGARLLTMRGAPLFEDLEEWLMSVYDAAPPARSETKGVPSAG